MVRHRHRLGLVYDQVAPGLQLYFAIQATLDFLLDPVQVEQGALTLVVLQQTRHKFYYVRNFATPVRIEPVNHCNLECVNLV